MQAKKRRNYLQSPYFFMCCNLCDANLDRPGQLAAAQQGDDLDTASQAALAGTLVSSLHRLKDIDNSGTLPLSSRAQRFVTAANVRARWRLLRISGCICQDRGRFPSSILTVRDAQVRLNAEYLKKRTLTTK